MRFDTFTLFGILTFATAGAAFGADLPASPRPMTIDTDRECSGRMVLDPKRKDHVRQDFVVCSAPGQAFDVDMRVCRIDGNQDICLQDGKGDFFYVWNVHRDPGNKRRFKISAQSSTNQKSDATFALFYRILFHPDPCTAANIGDRISCLAEKVGNMGDAINRLPGELANKPTPGYGCSDPGWCLLVTPSGDLFLGNPSGFGGPPLQPFASNVLRSQTDRTERSFSIECYPNYPALGRYCTGTDSRGNVYAGVMEPTAPRDQWFDFRRAAP